MSRIERPSASTGIRGKVRPAAESRWISSPPLPDGGSSPSGQLSSSTGVEVSGGSPTLSGVVFHDVGGPDPSASACEEGCRSLTIADGSRAIIEDSTFTNNQTNGIYNRYGAPRYIGNAISDNASNGLYLRDSRA